LDPNITGAFDEPQFIKNQTGPLANDHTHNIKIYIARDFPINAVSSVTIGGAYNGLSGGPLNYLGADYLYGTGTINILPQGSGGRLPWTHDIDGSFKYNYKLTDSNTLTASIDIFNIFNLQGVTSEDQNYTFSNVVPIYGGNKSDLANLKSVAPIGPISLNPDFGRPTSYQPPLTVRFGLKLTF